MPDGEEKVSFLKMKIKEPDAGSFIAMCYEELVIENKKWHEFVFDLNRKMLGIN